MSLRRDKTEQALQLLRAANPVPRQDDTIDRSFVQTAVAQIITSSRASSNIKRRQHHVSRSIVLAAAIMIVSLPVFVAPALGIGRSIVPFLQSPEPKQQIKEVIFALAREAPAGMDPHLIPGQARILGSLPVNGTHRELWAAPTSKGGMCYGWVGLGGGCDRLGTTPLSVSTDFAADRRSVLGVRGFVNLRYSTGVEIELRDGKTVRPPLLSVSDPIHMAFFSYDAAPDDGVIAVRGVREDEVVTTFNPPLAQFPPPDPIRDAIISQRRAQLQIETHDGKATIWTAPTRYGGECAWAEVAGRWRFIVPCHPAGYDFDQFAVQFVPTSTTVVLAGSVAGHFGEVLVRFADGSSAPVKTRDGFLLYEIPAQHFDAGSDVQDVSVRDADGNVITSLNAGAPGTCFAAVPTNVAPRPSGCANDAELRGS